MSEFFKKTLSVEFDGEQYEFRVPTVQDDIRIGLRAREIRRALVGPNGDAGEEGLDVWSAFLCKACATLEILLTKGPQWPYSPDAVGKPVIDSAKFPPESYDKVTGAVVAYRDAYATFRETWSANKPPVGDQALASVGDSQTKPV